METHQIRDLMEAYQAVYVPQELTEEQVWEGVENWVHSLLEEGYDLSDYTWEEMYERYITELMADRPKYNPAFNVPQPKSSSNPVSDFLNAPNVRQNATNAARTGMYGRYGTPSAQVKVAPVPNFDTDQKARDRYGLPQKKSTTPTPATEKPPTPTTTPVKTPTTTPVKTPPTATTAPKSTTPSTPTKPEGSAMDQWAKANPKLAAAKAEKDRIRGTSQSDNPLMKDMKDRMPMTPSVQSPTLKKDLGSGSGNQSLLNNPNANKSPEKPKPITSGVDLFDIVKGHLLDEGYADTEEGAEVIMVNMSQEWRESILESCGVEFIDESQYARENPEEYERSKEAKEGRRKRSGINDPNTGINSPAFKEFMAKQMRGNKKIK